MRLVIALVALLSLVSIGGSTSASAQAADVVADGLNGPQDVIVGPDGALWVIDTGVGGDEAVEFFNGETGELVTGGYGQTARVVAVTMIAAGLMVVRSRAVSTLRID